ncbi:hypothetical protein JCM11641_004947 [Rhodosporidiobolus odoratus]
MSSFESTVRRLRDQYGLPFAVHYLQHRRRYSNLLMITFSAYVLHSTYSGLTGSNRKAQKVQKTQGTQGQAAGISGAAEKGAASGASTRRSRRKAPRVEVDALFFQRLSRLLRIVLPSFRSKEVSLLLLHSCFLVLRTLLSLYVAALDGSIVSALVRAQPKQFLLRICAWMAVAVPATYTNSMLTYLQSKLAIAYRTRLTAKIHNEYLSGTTFYGLGNLDDRIRNPDQLAVVDVSRFANALAEIYSNVAKPVLDVLLYNYQLSRSVGAEGLIALTVVVQASAALLKLATPPFGRYAAEEQRLEGEYRFAHTRLLEHAEEIALLRGSQTEKNLIERAYFSLLKHVNMVFRRRMAYSLMEEGVVKWVWGSLGLCVCAVPVFGARLVGMKSLVDKVDLGSRTEGFVTNRRLLLSASDALGRLMGTYRDLAELSGYTARVTELLDTIEDVKAGRYQKRVVGGGDSRIGGGGKKGEEDEHAKILQGRGEVVHSDSDIVFDKVPIVTPNGDVLIESLSFHIKPGNHLLVVGGNGTGKSSLFRILGGLWPIYGGTVTVPPKHAFLYLPQRPYTSSFGTLRDQVIYPHTRAQMVQRGVKDPDLLQILKILEADSIVNREGGWDAAREWRDALSGGDKQRLAMARLFYHCPKYAILDECTSAVTLEVEKTFYEHATELGITLLTVSHRPSLWRYHRSILQFFGNGEWAFGDLDWEKRLHLQEEKQALEAKLAEVGNWEGRLADLLKERQGREERKEKA